MGKSKDAGGAGARRTGTEEGSKVGESKEHEDKKDGEKEKEEERAGDDTGDVGKREELEEEEVEDGEEEEEEEEDDDEEEVTVEKDTGAASAIDKVEPKEDETKKAIEEAIKSMREEKETMAITDKLSAEAARLAAVGENVKE